MAALYIRDTAGREGRITDDLDVRYEGPIAVEPYVNGIETRTSSADEAVEELLLTMIHDLDIEEIRRANAPPGHR